MKCEICKAKSASQVVKGVRNGRECDLFVCEDCSRPPEAKRSQAAQQSLADILFSLSQAPNQNQKGTPKPKRGNAISDSRQRNICPNCGLSRDTLLEHRLFGCAACYTTFVNETTSFLNDLQYGNEHVGRTPKNFALSSREAGLKAMLKEAIEREDFTEAAKIQKVLESFQT